MSEINPAKVLALNKAVVVLITGKRNKKPMEVDEVLRVAKKFEKYIKEKK